MASAKRTLLDKRLSRVARVLQPRMRLQDDPLFKHLERLERFIANAKKIFRIWKTQLRAFDSAQRAGKPVLRSQARLRNGNYFWQTV
jgi:hypothetical protein